MYNQHIIIGNTGRDAELRYTASGTAVCNFTVATRRAWKDRSTDEWKEETQWHRVVCWGQLAERMGQKLGKGDLVFVQGEHQYGEFEDRGGNKVKTSEIRAQVVRVLKQQNPERGAPSDGANVDPNQYTDDDIPF